MHLVGSHYILVSQHMVQKNINISDSQPQYCSRKFAVGVRAKINFQIEDWVSFSGLQQGLEETVSLC